MKPYLKAYDKDGKLLATGREVVGDRGAVIIPNLSPHTTYPAGSFFISWQAEHYETEKVAVPEFTTHESPYKEFAFYFNNHITVNPKSAYDLAVDNGFTGTEEEWVASIKGEKGDTLKYSDLTESQKLELKGEPGDSVVDIGSIGLEHTNFLSRGKNIFNKDDVQVGKLLSYTTGNTSDSNNYVTSNYIPVKPATKYTQSHKDVVVFYSKNKEFITPSLARTASPREPRTFTTPENCYYIRTSPVNTGADTYSYLSYQIEEGEESTFYESYKEVIDFLVPNLLEGSITNEKIKNNTIDLNKLSIAKMGKNLFNKDTATSGYYVNPTSGLLSVNANYVASDFIPIINSPILTKTGATNLYAFYDDSKHFISNTNTSSQTISVPSSARYIRVSYSVTSVASSMLVIGNTLPSTYEPYKLFIPKSYLEQEEILEDTKQYPGVYGKYNLKTFTSEIGKHLDTVSPHITEVAFIGDSWVQGGELRSGDRLTLPLRKILQEKYGDAGIGFISFANNHIGNGSVSVSLSGSWTQYDEGLGNIDKSLGLDSAMVESSTATDSIKVQFYEDLDYYEIHTFNNGKWRYNVDGGSWVEVDASQQEVTSIEMSLGRHTINIEIVSGKVTFIGSYAHKGQNGVIVHKIGNGGLKASHIASTDRVNYIKQLKRMRANTFGILLGTNDMAQSIPLENYRRDMVEVVSRIKEAKPHASIILIAPSGNKYDNTKLHTIEEYSNTQYDIAEELDISHISLYRFLGDFNTTNANGLMYTDGVHPNKLGGYAISSIIYDNLLDVYITPKVIEPNTNFLRVNAENDVTIFQPIAPSEYNAMRYFRDTSNTDEFMKGYDNYVVKNGTAEVIKTIKEDYTSVTQGQLKILENNDNQYALEIGATLEHTFTGHSISMTSNTTDTGGMWKASIDGTFVKNISTYANVSGAIATQLIADNLANTKHTITLEFIGADPEHPVTAPRGWIRTGKYNNSYSTFTILKKENVTGFNKVIDIAYPISNKEYAICVRPKGSTGEAEFFPYHGKQTSFKGENFVRQLIVDGKEVDLSKKSEDIYFKEARLIQKIEHRLPADTTARMECTFIVTFKDSKVYNDIRFKWVQPSQITSGYVFQMPFDYNWFDSVVVDLVEQVNKSDEFGSQSDFNNDNAKVYTGFSNNEVGKDYIYQCVVTNASMPIDRLWLQHRDDRLQKLYPQYYNATVKEAGDIDVFNGYYEIVKIKDANKIYKV